MRRNTPRRAARNQEAQPVRDALRQQGFCDWCGSDRSGLDVHEVSGGSTRALEIDQLCSMNLLCRLCHSDLEALPKNHAVCIGLALIRYRRPESYNLERFYKLTARRWPDEKLVEKWWQRLLMADSTTTTFYRE